MGHAQKYNIPSFSYYRDNISPYLSQKSVTILTEKLPSKNKKKKMVFVPAYQKPIGNQKQFVARV